jgi:putative transposase
VIWRPKYRRKVLSEAIQTRLKELIISKQEALDFEVLENGNNERSHVHLLLDVCLYSGIETLVGRLKGYTSYVLHAYYARNFPN